MKIDECFELGYVIKPHGLNGALDLFLDTDHPENYKDLESVYIQVEYKLIPFIIESIQVNGNKALVSLEGISSIREAADLKGVTLYLPESYLPPLEGNEFYFHEVIGFDMMDRNHGNVGKVMTYYDTPGQAILAVDHHGTEVLVPVNEWVITSLDRDHKCINVNLPDGLLDVYTHSSEE